MRVIFIMGEANFVLDMDALVGELSIQYKLRISSNLKKLIESNNEGDSAASQKFSSEEVEK